MEINIDLAGFRARINFLPSDCLAVFRDRTLPCFLRESDNEPCVHVEGEWWPVADVPRFVEYRRIDEKVRDEKVETESRETQAQENMQNKKAMPPKPPKKRLYNTATGKMMQAE